MQNICGKVSQFYLDAFIHKSTRREKCVCKVHMQGIYNFVETHFSLIPNTGTMLVSLGNQVQKYTGYIDRALWCIVELTFFRSNDSNNVATREDSVINDALQPQWWLAVQ